MTQVPGKQNSCLDSTGLGDIGSRPFGRASKEGARARVTLKKGHILEGHLAAGEYFGRSSDCG